MAAITPVTSKLGFIGIGYMGRPIAQRLLKAGFRLTAYDRHRAKAEELAPYGGTVAENVAELSSNCDVVLSCLASDEAVAEHLQRSKWSVCQRASRVIGHRPKHSQAADLAGAFETRRRARS